MATLQKITTNLWFDNQAEDAANHYISIFKNSKVIRTARYGKEGFDIHKMPEGTIMTVEFELEGQRFVGLNGGPIFKFNEAVSFVVNCSTQEEIDYYWDKLKAGGDPKALQCGWLKDKFGVSWQIVPSYLSDKMSEPHTGKTERLMKAMLQMKKLNLEALKNAYEEK